MKCFPPKFNRILKRADHGNVNLTNSGLILSGHAREFLDVMGEIWSDKIKAPQQEKQNLSNLEIGDKEKYLSSTE